MPPEPPDDDDDFYLQAGESDPCEGEQAVLAKLTSAYDLFIKLPRQHPKELEEWVDAFHRLQDIIGTRVARAYRPDIFPNKGE